MHLAICAIFRNEAPYLREWIEFHHLVGVQKFHLYQNRSDDDYQAVLRPYIDDGLVELTDWPRQPPCQIECYRDFISRHAGKPWWVAFLDCDEFLFSPGYATVGEALEAIASPEWGAVGVNWMCFGASGEEEAGAGLVTERFTQRAGDNLGANRHIKSVVRMDRVESTNGNPHCFRVKGGTFGESGEEISGPFSSRPRHSQLRIHHYHTKSRQEYLQRIARGNADAAPRRSPAEFDRYQADEVEDRSVWRFLPVLKQRIAERAECRATTTECATTEAPCARPVSGATPDGAEMQAPPRDFAGYRDCHKSETLLVCGCGSSLPGVVAPERFVTIGVNDVGRLLQPDYLVVINPRNQFSGDRFRYVENSQARALFTQLDLGTGHPNVVRFQLGRRGGTDVSDGRSLPYTRNSPYLALCLALHMGARRIGLIGVDFTEHHFFAQTGRHSLAGEINQINNEYAALAENCRRRGVEVFNLSPESRLTAFPRMTAEEFARGSLVPAEAAAELKGAKVFGVNYRFLSCGEVFSDGLRHAAEDLGMAYADAWWDDPQLADKVQAFAPDLVFVVHGRKYSQRSGRVPRNRKSAVWLLDEPYEVDDTARFAANFDTTFLNDPSTLQRHKNARYLPVCYDPASHHYRPGPREHRVGFIGGVNPAREKMLQELARRDLLSYVVGGPWRSTEVRQLSRSLNIPAAETAELYRQTRIVVNVFRTAHHFNRENIPARSMNPRIYEALACGALVVSERRPEIAELCPELPVFDGAQEMLATIEGLLGDPARCERIRKACIRRLSGHTYAQRLFTAFTAATDRQSARPWLANATVTMPRIPEARTNARADARTGETAARTDVRVGTAFETPATTLPAFPGWELDANIVSAAKNGFVLRSQRPSAPGSEAGLVGSESCGNVRLSFEIQMQPGATVVAKIHQAEQRNQASNSYHLMATGSRAYIARHNHVFHSFAFAAGAWHTVALSWNRGTLRLQIDGKLECAAQDSLLPAGYSFIGVKAGTAHVRDVQLSVAEPEASITEPITESITEPSAEPPAPERSPYDLLYDSGPAAEPHVSIITTIYDRVGCLDACLRSVQALKFGSYEQIIVADAPLASVLAQIRSLVADSHDGRHRLRLATLRRRTKDWGMTPAATGLSLAAGKYVCFLSDDNGYKPTHFEKLVATLDEDSGLGFAYSGCLYDGRATLNAPAPAFGRIDLGQPLFRRELFERHLPRTWPFQGVAWDWKMIERFLQCGVRWKHVSDTTFIFRLAKYPQLAPPARRKQTDISIDEGAGAAAQPPLARAIAKTPPETKPIPFTAPVRRNLIYHIWPVRGSMWRWNIEQIKQRLDLFNGQRLISIVHDWRSEPPAAVQEALEGCGCEYILLRNHPSGESATFAGMLRRVASQDVNDVTFYAHAKGVTHEPDVPQTIRRWTELSYRAALDDWEAVNGQLERFAVTGSFRRFGRFDAHRRLCDWHYHGTFFWMRHARVFARDCFQVPAFYCGVEAWPGVHFAREEGGCLLLDDLEGPATDEQFWKTHAPEIARWEDGHRWAPETEAMPVPSMIST